MAVTALARFTTPLTTVPYLSISEYRNAPTALDTNSLVDGGNQAAQDAALASVILRASSWIDTYCQQILAATVDIENRRVAANRDGMFVITPGMWPVLEVRDLQLGSSPSGLVALTDLSGLWLEPQLITVATPGPLLSSSVGPLQFGPSTAPGAAPLFCRYTYVNGYPVTSLAASASAAATSIQVADNTGIYGGAAKVAAASATPPATVLAIYDGANTEMVSVASVTGADPGPYTLALNSPLVYAHTKPAAPDFISITALPAGVKQAAILLVSVLIKTRGDMAIELDTIGGMPGHTRKQGEDTGDDLGIASELLDKFRREF